LSIKILDFYFIFSYDKLKEEDISMVVGFDNKKYLKIQSEKIKKRIGNFEKLYLEFGGKLLDDYHAVRVLPGFRYDSKLQMLKELKNITEIIICINADAIEKNKTRADHGITYDIEVLRMIDEIRKYDLEINSVVITLYNGQTLANRFIKQLERQNILTYIHTPTKGYPTDVETIVSDKGYGSNPYIKTTKPLVVVTAPGPVSGKLATCLSQLYHEHKRGIKAGYAKFETFPVWNLPLKHPINVAYEASTADSKDIAAIDSFHLEKYNSISINYNRDIEVFPILKNILYKIYNKHIYNSPTDMSVNTIGECIIDDDVCKKAAKEEIIRRYYHSLVDYKLGFFDEDVPKRIKLLMNELDIDESNRKVIKAALKNKDKKQTHSIAIELKDGTIITGKQTDLLSAPSSAVINAIKHLANIPDKSELLPPTILKPILELKENNCLLLQEVLIALSITAVTNDTIKKALNELKQLEGCEVHATYIIQNGDSKVFKNLKVNLTCEPNFQSDTLYIS